MPLPRSGDLKLAPAVNDSGLLKGLHETSGRTGFSEIAGNEAARCPCLATYIHTMEVKLFISHRCYLNLD
jgi:hypothetical protein